MTAPGVELERGRWRVRSLDAARQILRAKHRTRQAGFTAEKIPAGLFRHRPILISDGDEHDRTRREVSRFFAPAVIGERHGEFIADAAQAIVDDAVVTGRCRLDTAALHYTVKVTAEVVGLTAAPVDAMAARLTAFFRQPPVDLAAPSWGRTRRQWAQAAYHGLVPLLRFYLADVAPAIRAHRRADRDDVIAHLLAAGYRRADILVECVTYGTAGMVTTREFISMAAWRMLEDDDLRADYLGAEQAQRLRILEEIIRLDPVVGHLYRRTSDELRVALGADEVTIPAGELIDICVAEANRCPIAPPTQDTTPDKDTTPDVTPTPDGATTPEGRNTSLQTSETRRGPGLSFSDGAHACPGRPLALYETDVLLHTLLGAGARLLTRPVLGYDTVIEGYHVRDIDLGFAVPARRRR